MSSPLDKRTTRQNEKREREREERTVAALNPRFPYFVFEFDFEFFGIGANPPDKIQAAEDE